MILDPNYLMNGLFVAHAKSKAAPMFEIYIRQLLELAENHKRVNIVDLFEADSKRLEELSLETNEFILIIRKIY